MDSTSKDQEIFNKNKVQIITERVDDVPLLIAKNGQNGYSGNHRQTYSKTWQSKRP